MTTTQGASCAIVPVYTKTDKPRTLEVQLANIPDDMKQLAQWVLWRWELRDGKFTKVPINPLTLFNAQTNNPDTWGTFQEAASRYQRSAGKLDGIGFVLAAPFVGIDFDKCRNPDTGELSPEAAETIRRLDSYAEVSPSGTGVKVLVRATLPQKGRKRNDREVYSCGRFFTITGNHLDGSPRAIRDSQQASAAVYDELAPPVHEHQGEHQPSTRTLKLEDREVLRLAVKAKNATDFVALWKGFTSAYKGDHSSADLALCSMLAFYCGPDSGEQIDRLFRASKLYRDKWERDDYRLSTIEKALQLDTFYCVPNTQQPAPNTFTYDEERLAAVFESATPPEKKKAHTLLRWSDLKRRMLDEPPTYVVNNLIALSDLGMLSSLPGCGKSYILAHLVACVAQRLPFLGMDTRQHPVIYVNADQNSYHMIGERIGGNIVSEEGEQELERMLFLPKFEEIPAPFPDNYLTNIVNEVEAALDHERPNKGLIIVDTLRTAFLTGSDNGSENDTSALLRFIAPLKRQARETGWAVLLVHHNNRSRNDYAGGAIIKGQMEFTINLTRDDKSTIASLDVWTRRGMLDTIHVERNRDGTLSRLTTNTNREPIANDPLAELVALLPDTPDDALTAEGIRERFAEFFKANNWSSLKTAQNKVSELMTSKHGKHVQRIGNGTRNEPYRYHRTGQIDSLE